MIEQVKKTVDDPEKNFLACKTQTDFIVTATRLFLLECHTHKKYVKGLQEKEKLKQGFLD